MIREIIKKLRSCPPEEREQTAMALARTTGEEAVEELIRMAEGRRRGLFSRYELADQLIGLKALGETGRTEALQYLQELYSPVEGRTEPIHRKRVGREQGAHFVSTHEIKPVQYPNARRELQEKLSYEVETKYGLNYSTALGRPERIKQEETDTRNDEVHSLVQSSIEKLERNLGESES
jgi:hypothetical protein